MANPRSRAPSGKHNVKALNASLYGNGALRLEQWSRLLNTKPPVGAPPLSTTSCHWSQLLLLYII